MVEEIKIHTAAVVLLLLVLVTAFGTYSMISGNTTHSQPTTTGHVGVYVRPAPTETEGEVSAEVVESNQTEAS